MKDPRSRPQCGTNIGYRKHRTYGEYPCDECSVAHGRAALASKVVRYTQDRLQIEVTTLGLLLERLRQNDPTYYQQMRDYLGEEVVDACMTRARNDV